MTPGLYIRKKVFRFPTQHAFAAALGYSQAHISRIEDGAPFSSEAQTRVRDYARRNGIVWDNNWFFEVPNDGAANAPSPPPKSNAATPGRAA